MFSSLLILLWQAVCFPKSSISHGSFTAPLALLCYSAKVKNRWTDYAILVRERIYFWRHCADGDSRKYVPTISPACFLLYKHQTQNDKLFLCHFPSQSKESAHQLKIHLFCFLVHLVCNWVRVLNLHFICKSWHKS